MFAHLHLHTEYSLLDGACRIQPLIERVKELGMDSCAITDHGAMYGVVDFYKAARAQGIHPVIGCEVYVCEDMLEKTAAAREYSHLVLLCETQEGYQNLIKLVSAGFTKGFYYKPRVDYALLKKYSKGIIALSACLSGDIPTLLLAGRAAAAREMVARYLDIYGEGNFFLEMQDHGLADEKTVLPRIIALSEETGVPLVATNDCHYIGSGDARVQEILMCIQTGKTLSDEKRMRMETDQLYVKSEEEMRALFPGHEEALARTEEIAKRCHVEFDFSHVHLPRFPLEPGEEPFDKLRSLCLEGLARRYGPDRPDALERLDYELSVIRSMGYVDYFLIVWDFIRYAREHGILVGPGRGSGAGSITAYSLFITSVDPLKYNLIFERFLNIERVSMPDIDIDFDYERRGEVIDYVARRYGDDHVAQIITFGTMAAKGVIRDVGRVMDLSYAEVDAVAKLVPFALDMTLEKALSISSELRRLYEDDERIKELIDAARKLEGMPRHASTHAAGVLITNRPADEYLPLQTNDEVITTQFPMGTLEQLGLLKIDFLGLRTLTVIGDSLAMIKAGGGPALTPEKIPLDDQGVYDMISSGDTDGVFQLEGGGMRTFLTNMKPNCFEDIIAAISLYRPGPMESIPRYLAGKLNPDTVVYADPKLERILDVTYGCLVYQEQVMQMVRDIAGYSLGRSDLVRRAMAKKKHDVMAREKEYFIRGKLNDDGSVDVPGAVRMGTDEGVAERLFDEMTSFASYAFSKNHAAPYAMIAAQTGWLKLHYPAEFMAALMNSAFGNAPKIAYYIQYLRKHGVDVLPPDVNISGDKFSVERVGGAAKIRFGLGAVKNVGHGAIAAIRAEVARGGPFRDIYDFAERAGGDQLNKRAVECLIMAGALDALPGNRAQKLAASEGAMDGAARARKNVSEGQMSLFEFVAAPESPKLPSLKELDMRRLLAMEKEVTGVYITGHPLREFEDELAMLDVNSRYISQMAEEADGGAGKLDGLRAPMAGIITQSRAKTTKKGDLMGFVTLEDLYGALECLVFPRVWERARALLEVDSLVVLSGRLSVREDEDPKLLVEEVTPLSHDFKTPRDFKATPRDFDYAPPEADAEYAPAFEEWDAGPPPAAKPAKLYIKVADEAARDALLPLLSRYPGDTAVVFAINGRAYLAPENYWVRMDMPLNELRALAGPSNVVLKR